MILLGDCLVRMAEMAADSVDAIVTDPPYGLTSQRPGGRSKATEGAVMKGFMGMAWDGGVPGPEYWEAALRVAKPGAYLAAFGGTRTFHRLACAIEDAGWELRDTLMWVYASGFPKSHNGEWGGTALKPAWEPIILARKPLIGTVAANHAEHGTGGLNIDGCRVGWPGDIAPEIGTPEWGGPQKKSTAVPGQEGNTVERAPPSALGRWPANLIHDGSDEVLAAFPQAPGQQGDLTGDEPSRPFRNAYGVMNGRRVADKRGDSGSAARFFYCAKASRADRNDGCEGFPESMVHGPSGDGRCWDIPGSRSKPKANNHPTVKPTELMRWLCRLVTPAGGLVLDPFTGSGSTGRGAVLEGLRFVGCELDPQYVAIAEARIAAAVEQRADEAEAEQAAQAQQTLFPEVESCG